MTSPAITTGADRREEVPGERVVTPERPPASRKAAPTIITAADGRRGVFVSLEAADLTKDQPVEELAKTIDTLQAELAARETEIAELRQQIAELLAPAQTADDFGAALQSTVDELQTELSQLSNPLANFAVKEFRIDTRVGVAITRLGTVEYRFAAPGERVDPATQSSLSVTLVPVEKERRDRRLDPALVPSRPIGDVLELGAKLPSKDFSAGQYLQANHVFTLGELLRVAGRANIQARLTSALQIDGETLARWLSLAELMLIRSIDFALAGRLLASGVRSLASLRDADAEDIARRLALRGIEAATVRSWQASAASYLTSR